MQLLARIVAEVADPTAAEAENLAEAPTKPPTPI
jgi:hypothetical protein